MDDTFLLNGAAVHLQLFVAVINLDCDKNVRLNYKRYFTACDDMRYNSNESVEVIQGDSFGIDQLQRYRGVEEAIERALVEKGFTMFCQPIVETATGRITMFHDVHRKIVAEGIESEEQMNTLKQLECDYLQGYFYSKSIDKDAFISYVQHKQKDN